MTKKKKITLTSQGVIPVTIALVDDENHGRSWNGMWFTRRCYGDST